jgi:streptomycin 6-kinase
VAVDLTETRRLAHEIAAEWGLDLGEPFALANVSYVAPVGADAVLKLAWAGDDESLDEAAAFELWAGDGAVRVFRADQTRRALLEERAVPGTDISGLDDEEATAIAVEVASKLWRPAQPPFRRVADFVPQWLENTPSPLTPLARELWSSLEPSGDWLVHGDLHHHNILRHGDRFVAIDPKPYLADREYDVPSFIWNPLDYRLEDREKTERRIAAFVAAGLDDFRIRAWTVIRGAYLRTEPDFTERIRALLS